MDKRFWGIILVIGLIFVGIIWANGRNAGAPGSGSSGGKNSNTAIATTHTRGENSKKVTLVEYGDFQCPVCGLYEPIAEQVYEKHKADIAFQFRNFPLQQIHPNAFAASRAAEAAGLQDKYWEMHHQLYANQNSWAPAGDPLSVYQKYAQTIGLDVEKFKTDFASSKVNEAINADIREGRKLDITGTPAFFVNGKKVELSELVDNGNPTVDKFSAVIDAAIKEQATKGERSGTNQ